MSNVRELRSLHPSNCASLTWSGFIHSPWAAFLSRCLTAPACLTSAVHNCCPLRAFVRGLSCLPHISWPPWFLLNSIRRSHNLYSCLLYDSKARTTWMTLLCLSARFMLKLGPLELHLQTTSFFSFPFFSFSFNLISQHKPCS